MEGLCCACWREDPDLMFVIVDSNWCREDVMAHELMHIWLDLVEGYEDHRRYRDAANGRNSFTALSIQSFVIDCKVQERLKQRGFPLRQFTDDIVDSLHDCATALDRGGELANRSQEAVIANLLARTEAVPDLYELTSEDWERLCYVRRVFSRHVPGVVWLATRVAEAFSRHDYKSAPEALRLIDECLRLHFAYRGEPLDFERDFRIERDAVELCRESSPTQRTARQWVDHYMPHSLSCVEHLKRTGTALGQQGTADQHAPTVPPPGHATGAVALLRRNATRSQVGMPHPMGPAYRRVAERLGAPSLANRDPVRSRLGPIGPNESPLSGVPASQEAGRGPKTRPLPWQRGTGPMVKPQTNKKKSEAMSRAMDATTSRPTITPCDT